jgi:hypothetical protein
MNDHFHDFISFSISNFMSQIKIKLKSENCLWLDIFFSINHFIHHSNLDNHVHDLALTYLLTMTISSLRLLNRGEQTVAPRFSLHRLHELVTWWHLTVCPIKCLGFIFTNFAYDMYETSRPSGNKIWGEWLYFQY